MISGVCPKCVEFYSDCTCPASTSYECSCEDCRMERGEYTSSAMRAEGRPWFMFRKEGDRRYIDAFDGRDLVWVIAPDGRMIMKDGEGNFHADMAEELVSPEEKRTSEPAAPGWCRAYRSVRDKCMHFFPMMASDLSYCYEGESFSEYTPQLGEMIKELIRRYAQEGYEILIEFENHYEEYTYGEEGV